jgi:hypothetical protein
MNISVTCQCDLHSFMSTLSLSVHFILILDFCGCCKHFQHSSLPGVKSYERSQYGTSCSNVALLLCVINSTFSVLDNALAGFAVVGLCSVFSDPQTCSMGKEKFSRCQFID